MNKNILKRREAINTPHTYDYTPTFVELRIANKKVSENGIILNQIEIKEIDTRERMKAYSDTDFKLENIIEAGLSPKLSHIFPNKSNEMLMDEADNFRDFVNNKIHEFNINNKTINDGE